VNPWVQTQEPKYPWVNPGFSTPRPNTACGKGVALSQNYHGLRLVIVECVRSIFLGICLSDLFTTTIEHSKLFDSLKSVEDTHTGNSPYSAFLARQRVYMSRTDCSICRCPVPIRCRSCRIQRRAHSNRILGALLLVCKIMGY